MRMNNAFDIDYLDAYTGMNDRDCEIITPSIP